ncbi:MAG: hypothetical protein KC668_20000 [Myxococcales bacterium]|nr:hypothetical protein [Myxococcales bacterium]
MSTSHRVQSPVLVLQAGVALRPLQSLRCKHEPQVWSTVSQTGSLTGQSPLLRQATQVSATQ